MAKEPKTKDAAITQQQGHTPAKPVHTPHPLLALKRVIITPMSTHEKNLNAIFLSVSNADVSAKRYIPLNTETHIETILYETLKHKKTQVFVSERLANGGMYRASKQIDAYAIQDLPPLTKQELEALAKAQQARNAVD